MPFAYGFREFKVGFFDKAAVKKQLDAGVRKQLSKIGAFVRTRARSSIRTRKAVSDPGNPPSSHVGTLKKLLYFAFDPETKSVVIGPVAFGKGEAPGLLERGGRTTKRGRRGETRRLTYRARPFMKPAGDEEAKRNRDLFRNMVR